MKKLIEKLKKRWELESTWEIAVVLFIFSISGRSVLFVRKWAFGWLGFGSQTPWWEIIVAWILIVVPAYQILLLFFGTILGQFNFAWNFVSNNVRRIKMVYDKVNTLM